MIEHRVNPGKNRLYLRMAGDVTEEELVSSRATLAADMERLRPNFDLVNDVSELASLQENSDRHFELAAVRVRELGLRRVVRVVGRSAEAAALFERISRKLGFVSAQLAYSLEEADRVLDADPIGLKLL